MFNFIDASLIRILLSLSAIYSGLMYLYCAGVMMLRRGTMSQQECCDLSTYSFHLALCFILALGFLGMMGGA